MFFLGVTIVNIPAKNRLVSRKCNHQFIDSDRKRCEEVRNYEKSWLLISSASSAVPLRDICPSARVPDFMSPGSAMWPSKFR